MNDFGKKTLAGLLSDDPEIEFKIKSNIELHRKGFCTLNLSYADGSSIHRADIRIRQIRHEFLFGANAFMLGEFDSKEENVAYEDLFTGVFNTAVLPFYWTGLEPEDGKIRFSKDSPKYYRRPTPELGLDFCKKYHLNAKGHPLSWHSYWPEWVEKNPRRAMGRLQQRFEELARLCNQEIMVWDVVNEAQTRYFLERTTLPRFPRGYVEEIFRMAAFYFPEAQLFYNDEHCWWDHQLDYSPVYLLVEKLKNAGCRVDGLGMQFHMFEHLFGELPRFFNPNYLYHCFDLYAQLNLSLAISEISILGNDLYFGKGEGAVFQRLAAEKLYRLWFSHPNMTSIIWWNLINNTAINASQDKFQAGLIERDFTPRPAYQALKNLICKEWNTSLDFQYEAGKLNKFQGFYGDYTLEIITDAGKFTKEIKLTREDYNIQNITL